MVFRYFLRGDGRLEFLSSVEKRDGFFVNAVAAKS